MQPSVLAGEGLDDNEGWAEEYLTGVESDIYIGQARVQRSVLADEVEEMEGHEQRDRPHPFLRFSIRSIVILILLGVQQTGQIRSQSSSTRN